MGFYFCSSSVLMSQGSWETNCWVGTPNSKRRATTAEKLGKRLVNDDFQVEQESGLFEE